ncbi:SDR family oxidoreductase [Bacillus sp. ISL-40]|uniref:SDR family NAD(P)-dependent oxidoreductase n=1 Tax=unclassified Bacillus (in: firmicutes) TaxID=185979 RepID=UPI001BE89E22|nr:MULTISPECIES: SDR family oxidoreductase [unclassified Bacillus (in: firmicutes)]MBT2700079.1 SDR family oxidoreductase [Bacillus sp. ISL-40]MBT2720602.1 SDR family oxidoreductase [Bacillus sp. ISL-46]MBT2741265.1 SDR family oxidoreductase [Bacillus sp. ISL-77]
MLLKDKIAVITGGAKGMGEATSKKFAEQGATVVIADLDFNAARIVSENIQTGGGQARAYNQVDVTDQSTIKTTVDRTIEEFGRIDILVNCAGGTFGANGSSENINMNDWDRTMKLNLNGTLNPIMEILPYMKKQKSGKIVNFSSIGAFNAYTVVLHYHAAKGAVESLTHNLAFELAPLGIHANVISPGPIMTPFWDELMPPGPERDQFTEALANKEVPMQRMGTAEDIAGVCLFLASDLSDYVTGQKINVGGGMGNIISHNSTFLSSDENKQVNK